MNIKIIQSIFLIILSASLCSCGFSPIYKEHNNPTRTVLENIEISSINSIDGAGFYNHLQNILPHGNIAKYLLTTNSTFSKDISIIQENSDILRETITIKVSYNLKNKLTGDTITSGQFSRLSSFNTTFSPYSNTVRQQDTQKNLAIMSAEEVRNRIMLFTKNQEDRNSNK